MEGLYDDTNSFEDDATLLENVEPAYVSMDILAESLGQKRRIHRVPQHLRGEKNHHVYDPVVLSLGPYHYGKHQCRKMEEIKEVVLSKFISDNIAKDPTKHREFFYEEIFYRIKEIRDNYEHQGVDEYNDEALAEIILRDAGFLIIYIENPVWLCRVIRDHLGMSTAVVLDHDYHLLENQIPFWIIKSMLDLSFGENEANTLVCQHLSFLCLGDVHKLNVLPWKDNKDHLPLHLLEAARTILIKRDATSEATTETKPHVLTKIFKGKKFWKTDSINNLGGYKTFNLPFRSVTYLQTKGVHFRPSSYCMGDVIFTSYSCYGTLQLPIDFISDNALVYLSNLVAFEMSPAYLSDDFTITSYVNLMKSLLENPNDVKQLREKGILFSDLGSDEEVVKVFKEIQTYGFDGFGSFADVKWKIDEHCSSKTKTWIAEFIHNYCRTPWTGIALFAATFLLCLTFLQTYYTIRPNN